MRHRAEESVSSDRDDLGLRRTGARAEPTLTATLQEPAPPTAQNPLKDMN